MCRSFHDQLSRNLYAGGAARKQSDFTPGTGAIRYYLDDTFDLVLRGLYGPLKSGPACG